MSIADPRKGRYNSRIVSFLPSSTEMLYAIGAGDQITGVTHECKYPDDAKRKPKVINSSFDATRLTSREIDNKIGGLMKTGGNIYVINDQNLKNAKPDLIIAQGVCEVCAPFTKELDRASSVLGYKPELLVLDPHDLNDILISIMDVAEKVGRVSEGRKLVVSLQNRIDTVRRSIGEIIKRKNANNNSIDNANNIRPRIVCIEWIDPLFTAGHWIPQMVEIAGGINGLSTVGQPSRRLYIEEILKYNPDKIILMPCGFDLERTSEEVNALEESDKWKSLQAVQSDEVYAVDANSYFSKPGPRTVTGVEILAKIFYPECSSIVDFPVNSFTKITIR
ncbi:MAG TPA: cobalamin-binding protein [Nitrososphaeraceae archaeon]